MKLPDIIHKNIANFISTCVSHDVKHVYAFGSSITSAFDESTSDIDLLVEIEENDPLQKGEKLLSLWDTFEILFQRKVDLLTDSSIKNPVLKKNIDTNKLLIYDGRSRKVLV